MSVRVNILSLFLFYVSFEITSISVRCRRVWYVAFYFLSPWNLLFRCYRFGVVFLDTFHIGSKCAEGKFFDQCLVICQLKFTALRRFSPTSRSYSFHGKVNMQSCFAVTSVSFINGIRMLCVIFNIPFLMQRTRDRIQLFMTHLTIRISGVF